MDFKQFVLFFQALDLKLLMFGELYTRNFTNFNSFKIRNFKDKKMTKKNLDPTSIAI